MEKDPKSRKEARYGRIVEQLSALFLKNSDPISRMATAVAVLHHKMSHYFWTGFYLLKDGDLVVGPYQGPLACSILERHRGVCWAGVDRKEPIVVPNVCEFEGHIACDSRSQSEIVIPLYDAEDEIVGILDVDSTDLGAFDDTDREELVRIVGMIYSPRA